MEFPKREKWSLNKVSDDNNCTKGEIWVPK